MAGSTSLSVNKIKIRLTNERLSHIFTNHPEMTEDILELKSTLTNPDFVCEGKRNEYIAIKARNNHFLVVIYKEDKKLKDGFIITAFKTTNIDYYLRKKSIWKK